MTANDFTRRFTTRVGVGTYIVDQLNFQLSCYDNLQTTKAKQLAEPLVIFMRAYIVQLEQEIRAGRGIDE
jgi:hypothetical protein